MVGFDADGNEFLHYRKRHPWYPETWATPGDAAHPIVVVGGLRTATIAICFDIQFLSELPLGEADLLLFPSAWVAQDHDERAEIFAKLGMRIVNANWESACRASSGRGALASSMRRGGRSCAPMTRAASTPCCDAVL